jgi:predicted helicase
MKQILLNHFLETTNNLSILKEMAQKVIDTLALTFIIENEVQGNVCFANSSELRTEYRETFRSVDLQNYIYATLHSMEYQETQQELSKRDLPPIPIPKDRTEFWKLVELGRELRKAH